MMRRLDKEVVIMCDACDERDGDYTEELKWDSERKVFRCRFGHEETIGQALRHHDESMLIALVTILLEAIP